MDTSPSVTHSTPKCPGPYSELWTNLAALPCLASRCFPLTFNNLGSSPFQSQTRHFCPMKSLIVLLLHTNPCPYLHLGDFLPLAILLQATHDLVPNLSLAQHSTPNRSIAHRDDYLSTTTTTSTHPRLELPDIGEDGHLLAPHDFLPVMCRR